MGKKRTRPADADPAVDDKMDADSSSDEVRPRPSQALFWKPRNIY